VPVDLADKLGPKGPVYVALAREQWLAPLERASVRRTLLIATLGVILIVMGIVGAFRTTPEAITLVAVGCIALGTSFGDLRTLYREFSDARRIGWLEPTLDGAQVVVGEPFTFSVVLHARRKLTVTQARVLVEARKFTGAQSEAVVVTLPVPLSQSHAVIQSGDDWRDSATCRIPESAPASFYDVTRSVRWMLTLELKFGGAEEWHRQWPLLVYPAAAS
jgi:hypothetical protein